MKALQKNIAREIKGSRSRFLSILAIIGLSTGVFTGVKSSSPSMIETGETYFAEHNLMDLRLVSSIGFAQEDIDAIKALDCTVDVMPSYMADLIMTKDEIDSAVRVYALPELTDTNASLINSVELKAGRMPQRSGECLLESYFYDASDYQIGDKITFKDTVQGNNTLDIVKNLEYTIVGAASTPVHITYQLGNTTVGDGSISFFIMVPSEEFVSERYTNVYLTSTAGQVSSDGYSEEYKQAIEEQTEVLEELSQERIRIFNETTLKDAQQELLDAKQEYNDKKAEAKKELEDGEKELLKGQKEMAEKLIEAEKTISQGEKEIQENLKKLEQGQQDYTSGLESAQKQLEEGQQQYQDGLQQYQQAQLLYDTEIEKAKAQLEQAQNEYNLQYTLFYTTTKPQADLQLSVLNTAIEAADEVIHLAQQELDELEQQLLEITSEVTIMEHIQRVKDRITEYQNKVDDYRKQYEDAAKQLSDGEKQLQDAKQQLEDANAQFLEKKLEGMEQLSSAKTKLELAQEQLNAGRLAYQTAMTTGLQELQAGQEKLSQAQAQLESGKEELLKQKQAGMEKLKAGREKLLTGKAEAEQKLKEAEEKISDAEKTIDKLQDAKWYIYTREDNPGYSGLKEDAMRVDNIAAVFPFFFLLVAALVCLTTMTRMVEERRTEIGTLKALGYSNGAIAAKYFIYAAAASVIGSVLGAIIGVATLPFIIVDTYGMMYVLPATRLVISYESFFFSAGTGLLCTCLVAVITCYGELKIRPATLMRPKAPKPGKRILLEHIRPLWKRMNFTSKVTARNIFRYKARFLMTVIGVAGCTALIIGGLGLKDSLTVIADRQYKEISVYDEIYALSESGTAKEKAYIMSRFHQDQRFAEALLVSQNWTTVTYEKGTSKISLRYIIGENEQSFEKIFTLRDRATHEKILLNNEGVVINERLGDVIGARVGDQIDFTINETHYQAAITALTENYAGNYLYMTPEFYQQLTRQEPGYNIVYTQLTEEAHSQEKEIANEWMQSDEIVTVSLLNEQLESILDMLESLNVIVLVLVVCAGMLAMVVLYNLTNINIAERVREIATIKVLGFYNLETANYIYRENMVLTLTGALVGLPLGTVFTTFIVQAIQMDMVMFPLQINTISYLIGFALTIVFSLLVNFLMYFKMNKISMVESLKSIE